MPLVSSKRRPSFAPRSHTHSSVNEVICHGIPDGYVLKDGDIVNGEILSSDPLATHFPSCFVCATITPSLTVHTPFPSFLFFSSPRFPPLPRRPVDISIYHNGFHADLNETFLVGTVDAESLKLVRVTYECLFKAIEACASRRRALVLSFGFSFPYAPANFFFSAPALTFSFHCLLRQARHAVSGPGQHHHKGEGVAMHCHATVRRRIMRLPPVSCSRLPPQSPSHPPQYAQKNKMTVVRTYCGHGINELFHCAPNVPHYSSASLAATSALVSLPLLFRLPTTFCHCLSGLLAYTLIVTGLTFSTPFSPTPQKTRPLAP